MSVPRIVSADEWLAERKELLAAEEQAAEMLTQVIPEGAEPCQGADCPGLTGSLLVSRHV